MAYDRFFTDPDRGLTEVGCWAHARRHFRDALESDRARMRAVLALIAQLYKVEKVARQNGLRGEDLRLAREHGARPVLDQLHEFLQKLQDELLPKSVAGQAVSYALRNWPALTRYLEDGDLAIDNNATERSLRGIAVGRKNWLFFGSDNGGRARIEITAARPKVCDSKHSELDEHVPQGTRIDVISISRDKNGLPWYHVTLPNGRD